MIKILKKEYCSGCTACASICPKCCIHMKADMEGFLYPEVDTEICINCGACEKVCPILNPIEEKEFSQKGYLVQHKNMEVRLDSTSGGAFTAIASVILCKGGVVFGAAYDENFHVYHTYVENEIHLAKFRNSKYVQSDLRNSFVQVKEFLKKDRWVCFSGTPCQIEGLVKYLGRQYERLLLVDLVCHGVPSPLVWNKYLEYQNIEEQKPDNIRFRDKYYGYKYSTMSIIRNGQNTYHAGSQLDPMLRAFFSDICNRPTCYKCPFKKRYRVSDLTLWDCFSVYDYDETMDDDNGTTRVLCHTEKGKNFIQYTKEIIKYKEVDASQLVINCKEMYESVKENSQRKKFFLDAQKLSGKDLFNKYYPITVKVKIKTLLRKLLLITGSYSTVKKILNKVRGR